MIDELDQLQPEVNFGHFMKIIHETLIGAGLDHITFILAGQQGTYSRMLKEDPSFERIVRHIPLATLDLEASEFVLDFASTKAHHPFRYENRARELILLLSSGYPYVLHLLGDSAYSSMEELNLMRLKDVIGGIESLLQSDKREKYLNRLRELPERERLAIIAMSEFPTRHIPTEIPISWLANRLEAYFSQDKELTNVLESLESKGHIKFLKERTYCRFVEELFRVFVSLIRIEQREIELRRKERAERTLRKESEDEALISVIRSGRLDFWEDLDAEQREHVLHTIRRTIDRAEYDIDNISWEDFDFIDL